MLCYDKIERVSSCYVKTKVLKIPLLLVKEMFNV